jgi:hypothetical protein
VEHKFRTSNEKVSEVAEVKKGNFPFADVDVGIPS